MKFVSTTRLEVRLEHAPDDVELVGHLVLHQRQIAFEYKAEFIERRPTISPLRLPLRVGLHSASESHLRGLFGVFDDSLPDGWGRLLMDRTFLARSIRPAELTALDRLAYLGRHTMGALTYHPCSEPDVPSETLDLAMLAAAARQLYDGTTTEVLPALRRAGGSPGGARPKVLVGMRGERLLSGVDTLPPDYQPWLIKFATRDDPPNAGALEFIYARMAVAAGIKMPEVQLLAPLPDGERCFAVRRFDRDDNSRIHVHTLANLLHADFRMPNLDYEHLLRITQKLTRSHSDVRESFRRAVFNLLAHNRDDHGKNFAFLMGRDGTWQVSPAYDLMFVEGPGGEHTMTFKGEGRRPTWAHLQQLAALVSVEPSDALEILAQVRDGVGSWQREATALKLPTSQIREISDRLAQVAAAAALPAPARKPARPRRSS
jgi:serine/threonine-protein kinase HipA